MHKLNFRPTRRSRISFLQVLGDNAAVHIKKLADCFLRQPDIIVLHTDFYPFLMGVFRKDEEIDRAVANL